MEMIIFIMLAMELIVISYVDIKQKQIEPRMLIAALVGGLMLLILNKDTGFLNHVSAMIMIYGGLALVSHFTKGSIGMGDVKLCAVLAIYLGVEKAIAMIGISMLMCGLTGLVIILLKRCSKKDMLPFSPFAAVAFAAVMLL